MWFTMLRGRSRPAGAAVTALAVAAVVALTPGTAQADAAYWYTPVSVDKRVCGATHEYSGIYHQICLEYASNRTQVRAAGFIYASTASYFQASVTLTKGGGQGSWNASCPTAKLTVSGQRECFTPWVSATTPYYVADAQFGISGTWRPVLRAIDTPLIGKAQETSTYCGVAAVQTALATMRRSVPSQSTLAGEIGASGIGSMPWNLPPSLNSRLASTDTARYVHRSADVSVYPAKVITADNIYTSLARGKPPIILATTARIPWYSSSESILYKHYLTIVGVNGVYDSSVLDYVSHPYTFENVTVWDPWNGGSEHVIDMETLLTWSAASALVPDSVELITTPTS
jgi:hypothetical protein